MIDTAEITQMSRAERLAHTVQIQRSPTLSNYHAGYADGFASGYTQGLNAEVRSHRRRPRGSSAWPVFVGMAVFVMALVVIWSR